MAATYRWVEEIARRVGRSGQANEVLAQAEMVLWSLWESWKERARGKKLGFVVGPREAGKLLGRNKRAGIDMLSVLFEVGFGVELLIWVPEGMSGQTVVASILRFAGEGIGSWFFRLR